VDEGTSECAGTNNGYVLCSGVDGLGVLGQLSCAEGEGIHLPLPTWDLLHRLYISMYVPKVLVHTFVNCLMLLINTYAYYGVCGIWCCPSVREDNFWIRRYSNVPRDSQSLRVCRRTWAGS